MKRVHTGANIASAMHGLSPNRNGPLEEARQSRQMAAIRSMSAWAPAQTLKPGCRALTFIGSAERRLPNPECISPETERQRARSARALGNNPASGQSSLRYSPIASVSDLESRMGEARHQERR